MHIIVLLMAVAFVEAQDSTPTICYLHFPKDPGTCKGSFPKYFYNAAIGACEEFIYGGCGGNLNRYSTIDECQQACDAKVDACASRKCPAGQVCQLIPVFCVVPPCPPIPACVDICTLSKDPGPCEGEMSRYSYNSATKQCEQFTYGGCQGNANNFGSMAECRSACMPPCIVCQLACEFGKVMGKDGCPLCECKLSPCATMLCIVGQTCVAVRNPCPEGTICDSDDYEGHCIQARCALQKDAGPCKALNPRYFYNVTAQKCDKFNYGGCLGNNNRFEGFWDCRHACEDPCNQPKDPGPCKGSIASYSYNSTSGACDEFVYGGCLGSANKFATLDSCQQTCNVKVDLCATVLCKRGDTCITVKKPCPQNTVCDANDYQAICIPNKCTLKYEVGTCQIKETRWYFDMGSRTCQEFTYSGCGGNENKFVDMNTCAETCRVPSTVTPIVTVEKEPLLPECPYVVDCFFTHCKYGFKLKADGCQDNCNCVEPCKGKCAADEACQAARTECNIRDPSCKHWAITCKRPACEYDGETCEWKTKTIEWACGEGYAAVARAFWGRDAGDDQTCTDRVNRYYLRNPDCPGDDYKASDAVTAWCRANVRKNGNCKIHARKSKLRIEGTKYDPCRGTFKYLRVCKFCVPAAQQDVYPYYSGTTDLHCFMEGGLEGQQIHSYDGFHYWVYYRGMYCEWTSTTEGTCRDRPLQSRKCQITPEKLAAGYSNLSASCIQKCARSYKSEYGAGGHVFTASKQFVQRLSEVLVSMVCPSWCV